jgi:SAM-dependent methyltransferase
MNTPDLLIRHPVSVTPGKLGPRYITSMQALMYERLKPYLRDGVRILDLGGGRNPFLPPELRPQGARYVGADISTAELAAAPSGSYDATVAADISYPLPIEERFDIVLSWQVLEHVPSMPTALRNISDVLDPGGWLFAQLSGARAVFALLTRVVPYPVRVRLMTRLLDEPEENHFPTRYDHCLATDLRQLLSSWSSAEVVPYFRGATYFEFSALLQRAYLRFENVLAERSADTMATHYLIVSQK